MVALRTLIHERARDTPHSLVFGQKINLPIDNVYPLAEHPNKTGVHPFVPEKCDDMQGAHEAAGLNFHTAQQKGNTLYNSKAHGP